MKARIPFLLMALAGLSACATTNAGYETAEADPLEDFNRGMYSFNDAVDRAVLKPVAQGYRAVVPAEARTGVSNALDNTGEPLSFVNAFLQGKFKRAFRAVDRFAINSTYGFLGTTDRAAELGLEQQLEDFGQTLAVWGVGSGPYIVLPVLGPSSLRDAVGFGADTLGNPWGHAEDEIIGVSNEVQLGETALGVIDTRSGLIDTVDPVLEGALDPYTTMKSAYLQNRTAAILNEDAGGAPSDGGAFEEMEDFEPFEFEDESGGEAEDDPS